jgi:histidinol-phosphate aminotransferase
MSVIEERIAQLVRPEIRALEPYHVPDATGLVKLDAMENPYGWPEAVKARWLEVLRECALNRYPDPQARRLRARLREALELPAGLDLMLGNGSDELIQILLLALARPGAVVLAPEPTFVMYRLIATYAGLRYVGLPLGEDFVLDLEAMRAALRAQRPAVVFLAYPNNPTGNLFDRAAIEAIIREAPGLVVVDEAYYAFSQESVVPWLVCYDNLLVLRTLSKQGLAGLRLGMLIGAPAWLAEFDKLRLPYNINVLTQASTVFALGERALLDAQAARIREDRERLYAELATIPGIRVWPSRANFLLFRVERRPAGEVYEALRARGILVKNLDPAGGALAGCLRVTVGTPAENESFLTALRAVL